MLGGVSVWGVAAIIGVVVAAAVAVLVVLYLRFGFFRRSRGRAAGSGRLDQSRIEVLESTYVDADRRLVLLRCDQIEHLVLIGGPADLVVENDVKKVRGPGAPALRTPVPETGQLISGGLFDMAGGARSQPAAAERPAPSPAERRPLAPPSRSGPAPAVTTPDRTPDTREQRQRPGESRLGRREAAPPQRRTIQPAPLGAGRSEPGRGPQAPNRGNGRQSGEESPGLPPAGVPWAASDSIENEIVRALRVDPVPRARDDTARAREPATFGRKTGSASTTLGDLADRLEEALAQEVQSAGHGHKRPEPDVDEFGFDSAESGAATPRHDRPFGQKGRQPGQERERETQPKPEATGASPEPERRRESAGERREEAPVISLNSRRRESADSLEDEMARLLGELTGDTKGR
jgi:hypothetical protein